MMKTLMGIVAKVLTASDDESIYKAKDADTRKYNPAHDNDEYIEWIIEDFVYDRRGN